MGVWRTEHFGCPISQCTVYSLFSTIEILELPCEDLTPDDMKLSTYSLKNHKDGCSGWRNYIGAFDPGYSPPKSDGPPNALACKVAGWNRYFHFILQNDATRERMSMLRAMFAADGQNGLDRPLPE